MMIVLRHVRPRRNQEIRIEDHERWNLRYDRSTVYLEESQRIYMVTERGHMEVPTTKEKTFVRDRKGGEVRGGNEPLGIGSLLSNFQ